MRPTASTSSAVSFLHRARPFLAIVALWAVVEGVFVWVGVVPILKGDLIDADAYLQLLNVSHLAEGGSWYDGVLPRSNWPYGEVATWSHALDIVLLAGAALLRPFMNLHDALFWFGVAVSPLLALACAFAVAWMARPLLASRGRWAGLVLLLQPAFLSYTDARGPNHHGLLFLAFILSCGFALRSLAQPENRRAAIGAGAMIAVGIWISLELLLLLAVTLVTFGLLWLFYGERWARANRGFAIGFAVMVAILLPIERSPIGGLLAIGYDRLSIVHLALGLLLLGFWALLPRAAGYDTSTIMVRGVVSGVGIAAACAAIYAIFPKFFGGPLAEADPAMIALVIKGNADWLSAFPSSLAGTGRFLLYVGTAALCVPWTLWVLWEKRRDGAAPGWFFLALALLVYAGMTLWALRFSPFAEIVSLIPLVSLVVWIYRRLEGGHKQLGALVRAGAMAAIIVGPPYAGVFLLAASFAREPASADYSCRVADIAPVLDDPAGLGARQHVIAAGIHRGPEIMYRTPYAVLATPMIHNTGALAIYRMMTAGDDAAARAIIVERGVDLLLLCPASGERDLFRSGKHEDTFYNRLIEGRLPGWIRRVPLDGPPAKGFYLFAVRPDAM